MTLLQVASVSFGYGAYTLFDDVSFSLLPGERAALVAPNGAGKSTLLRLIAGELSPDKGSVVVRKGVALGYYRQSHELSREGDVMDALLSSFPEVLSMRHALREAQEQAASGNPLHLNRLASLMDAYQSSHGDELERKVTILSAKLGFCDNDLTRSVKSLSGGEQGRLLLGIVLAREPTLLLLDEPTNHLDLDTIAWLEGYLGSYRGGVLVVSHDRAFLDAVTNETLELGKRSFRVYPLSYSRYEEARADDLMREQNTAQRQEALVAKTEDFIRRNIAGQKTKQAQSRRKMLEKLERLERPEDVWKSADRVRFRFAPATRTGDRVLEAAGLSAERGTKRLFSNLDLLIRRGERVGIIGPNGSGKTTLLKLLAGAASEGDQGSVQRGTNLCEGYFDQQLGSLNLMNTPIEEIRSVRGDFNVDGARQYLGRFRFSGDDVLRPIDGMSGGERTRLALAKLLLEPKNLLFLDEPTNHLDIPAAQILEEALMEFEGTVLFVSHDRRFLHNVATRIVSVRSGSVEVFNGGYQDWVERSLTPQGPSPSYASTLPSSVTPLPEAHRKAAAYRAQTRLEDDNAQAKKGKEAYEAERAAGRARERKQRRFKDLEGLIAQAEEALAHCREELKQSSGEAWEALASKAQEEQSFAKNVEALIEEWMSLGEELTAEDSSAQGSPS